MNSTYEKALHAVYNKTPDVLPGFKFKVYIDDSCIGFSKVTNIQSVAETRSFQEGGVNDRVYSLITPAKSEQTMVLERGIPLRSAVSMFTERNMVPGYRIPGDVVITLHDRNGAVAYCVVMSGCYIKKISIDGLDSMSGNPVIQRMEITYEVMDSFPMFGFETSIF